MSIPVSTLRPGLLVSINTSIKGNVKYNKINGETVIRDDGSEYTDWETERTVRDPKEQKLATEVRSKARNFVVSVCIPTEHGLLCPTDKRDQLDEAFDKARALCEEFNAKAQVTRLKFNALTGLIVSTLFLLTQGMGLSDLVNQFVQPARVALPDLGFLLRPESERECHL